MRLLSKSPGETSAFGARLGGLLKRGDTVCLYGDLGSGKTTMVKGIASALGIPERDVTSASFTIIAEYTGTMAEGPVPFYHIDLYRLRDEAELESIGIEGYIGRNGIAVVEWAERLGEITDTISVKIRIVKGDEREIIIEGVDEKDWDHL